MWIYKLCTDKMRTLYPSQTEFFFFIYSEYFVLTFNGRPIGVLHYTVVMGVGRFFSIIYSPSVGAVALLYAWVVALICLSDFSTSDGRLSQKIYYSIWLLLNFLLEQSIDFWVNFHFGCQSIHSFNVQFVLTHWFLNHNSVYRARNAFT